VVDLSTHNPEIVGSNIDTEKFGGRKTKNSILGKEMNAQFCEEKTRRQWLKLSTIKNAFCF
jgi:hypothetical protein